MSVTIKDVEKVAKLARLTIKDEKKEIFVKQLSNILEYIETLNELNTDKVAPTSYVQQTKNVFREDEAIDILDKNTLAGAPASEHSHFKVPKIM